jgi:hypothetical protein
LGVILLRFTFGVINWRLEDYKNNWHDIQKGTNDI